jgi:hypothetical protein
VCQMIAVLPATSVERERGFSILNRIKTDPRNKLLILHLESLMRVSSTSMDVVTLRQEHSEYLIRRWRSNKARRIGEKGDTLLDDDID